MDPEEKRFLRDGIFFALLIALWFGLMWVTNVISCDIRTIEDVEDDDSDEVVQMADTAKKIIADTEAHADRHAADLKPESDLHVHGIILRLYRLEALLTRASQYVPRYDDDGHPLPLKQVIDTELGSTQEVQ